MSETISPNSTIAQYTILSKIGEGGMGEVYRARDSKLGRDVAIKVLPATLSENVDRLNRFEQEAQAAGALNHPNILVIHHIGLHNGAPYIVSELLEGETLRDRLVGGALPQRKATEGLNRFEIRQEKFEVFTDKHGLPNNVVYGILTDNVGGFLTQLAIVRGLPPIIYMWNRLKSK